MAEPERTYEPVFPWDDGVPRTWLADPATDEQLDPRLTLDSYGLADGDLIVLCVERPAESMYRLDRSPNPAALLERMQLSMHGTAPDSGGMLWGVLLYTSVDTGLATYVRTHFEDLDALSGPTTRLFVMERRTPWADARRYWRRHLEPELYQVLAPMQWLRWQPYDPQGAYRIASLLKVDPALLPCLVLFNGRADLPWGKQKVVFPVEEATPGTSAPCSAGSPRHWADSPVPGAHSWSTTTFGPGREATARLYCGICCCAAPVTGTRRRSHGSRRPSTPSAPHCGRLPRPTPGISSTTARSFSLRALRGPS